jgi:phosphatidylglycerophosphatase A
MTKGRLPSWPVVLIATSFGSGFAPKGPGTAGTLTAIPMAWGLARLGWWGYLAGLLVITAVGTWAASVFVQTTGTDDDQRIVVDEVAGYLLTLAPVAKTPVALALAFVLFRLFDIWKPWPVRWVDRTVGGGFGVMADDLAAAVYGGIGMVILERTGAIAWISTRIGL